MQDILLVVISADCLCLLSVSFLSFISRGWGTFAEVPWYAGPPAWVGISAVIVVVFVHDRVGGSQQDFGNAFSIAFLAWVVSNIVLGVYGFYIWTPGKSVPHWLDEAILFGTVTLGLAQLGMAGILRNHLCNRRMGLIAWLLTVAYGAIIVVISIVLSIIMLA